MFKNVYFRLFLALAILASGLFVFPQPVQAGCSALVQVNDLDETTISVSFGSTEGTIEVFYFDGAIYTGIFTGIVLIDTTGVKKVRVDTNPCQTDFYNLSTTWLVEGDTLIRKNGTLFLPLITN